MGIENTNPQQALHITGANSTIRIEGLNSTNEPDNNGIDPSVVMVDANGDMFLDPRVDDFQLDDSDSGTFFPSTLSIGTSTGAMAAFSAYTTTFTLTRETLVEVVFWTGVGIEQWGGGFGGSTSDGFPRLYGGLVQDQATGVDIIYSAGSYTNSQCAGTINIGYFTIGGNGFITLPAATHTLELIVFVSGGESDGINPAEGVIGRFGQNGISRFQVIYHN